jgi:hypothetical protein
VLVLIVKRFIITILIILAVIGISFLGFLLFKELTQVPPVLNQTEDIKLSKQSVSNVSSLLTDIGWYGVDSITLLNGDVVKRSAIKNIIVEYSESVQPYLQQGDESGVAFASINTVFVEEKLVFTVHVAKDKLTISQDKNWWINHQVIRALNKMLYPALTDELLIEKDRKMYDKYGKEVDLWEINF